MLGKQIFAVPRRKDGIQVKFDLKALLHFPRHTWPLFFADIFGDSSIHGVRNGTPLLYSCLENSMDRGAWWATVHGVTKSWTQLSTAQQLYSRNRPFI